MRLTSILILMLALTSLHAQSRKSTEKWIGVNNLSFKNKDMNTTVPLQTDSSILIHTGLLDKQFSIGLYFRIINKKRIYQQFDLFQMGWNRDKEDTIVDRTNLGYTQTLGGKDIKSFNLLLGYQIGKLFPIIPKLTGDVGIRGFFKYRKVDETPLSSSSYLRNIKSTGLGLNLTVGLNYQVHKKINIGYHFVPISTALCLTKTDTNNPILTPRASNTKNLDFESSFFKSIIGTRNIDISYVF